jgi:hypothetical protein
MSVGLVWSRHHVRADDGCSDKGKRQQSEKLPPSALMGMMGDQMMPYPRKQSKRRHPDIVDTLDPRPFWLPDPSMEIARQPGRGERKVPLMVKDLVAQEKWFAEAFKAVQQVGCRTIAKVWIKKIHPKKVSCGRARGRASGPLTLSSNPRIHTTAICPKTWGSQILVGPGRPTGQLRPCPSSIAFGAQLTESQSHPQRARPHRSQW